MSRRPARVVASGEAGEEQVVDLVVFPGSPKLDVGLEQHLLIINQDAKPPICQARRVHVDPLLDVVPRARCRLYRAAVRPIQGNVFAELFAF